MLIYYNEHIMRLKVCCKFSSAILDIFGCNQIILCLQPISFFQRLCSVPFPPVSINIQYPTNYITVGGLWYHHDRNVYLKQIILGMIEQNWLNGHGFEQTPGDSGRQRNLVCYSPLSLKGLDRDWTISTQDINSTKHNYQITGTI